MIPGGGGTPLSVRLPSSSVVAALQTVTIFFVSLFQLSEMS